jgi:hypothetical protein
MPQNKELKKGINLPEICSAFHRWISAFQSVQLPTVSPSSEAFKKPCINAKIQRSQEQETDASTNRQQTASNFKI